MILNIPQNQINFKYTSGKEYMYLNTYKEYQGYYYEISNKFFAGKIFDSIAPELIKFDSNKVNILLENPATAVYGKVSNITLDTFIPTIQVYNKNLSINGETVDRFFIQKTNEFPLLIKEVNKESYERIESNPLYKTVAIRWDIDGYDANLNKIDRADIFIPGIKEYLKAEDFSEDSGEGDG